MSYLPVRGYEGLYEVSVDGQIRSVDRTVMGKDGKSYPFKGRLLSPNLNTKNGYLQVSLWKNGEDVTHYLHRLVAQTHIPNPQNLPEVNHKNGIRADPRKDNLEWVTSSENSLHAVQTGLRVYLTRLSKDEFVECLWDVISGESYQSLSNRVPYKVPFLSTKLRKIAKELGVEDQLNASLMEQRILRARINGANHRPTNRVD